MTLVLSDMGCGSSSPPPSSTLHPNPIERRMLNEGEDDDDVFISDPEEEVE